MSSSKIPVSRKSTAQSSIPTLKRCNSQSSIPVLRRSNSQSSIPLQSRQSRSYAKDRSQGRKRAKSLAVKSPLITSNLPYSNYNSTSVRARSTSNMRYTVTPKQEISPFNIEYKVRSTSSCSSGTRDSRPVNDKDWQRSQFMRVNSFLNELDPCLPSIKPLSISSFITIMDLLLKHFDNRIMITKENYKDEVIKYLKIFSYPGTIPPSLIKNISAPHEFPKVLAIWSWLIDRIEIMRYPDKILQPVKVIPKDVTLYHTLLSYNIQKFKLWNQNKEAGADECLRDELYAIYDIKSPDTKEKQVGMLKAKAISLEETKRNLNLEKKTKQLQHDNKRRKDMIHEYKQQREMFLETSKTEKEEKLRRIKCVKQLIQMEEDKKKELQSSLAAQKHDYAEYDNINKKIQEVNHSIKLYQDRLDAQEEIISKYNDNILTTKRKLEEKIHKYNNGILKWSLLNLSLNELKIRETNLMEPTFPDELKKTMEKKNEWIKKFKAELKESQNAYMKIYSENEKIALDNNNLMKKIDKSKSDIENIKTQLKKLNNTKETEINKKQVHLEKLNENLTIQIAQGKRNVEECKKKVQDTTMQLAKKKDYLKSHCEESEKFFIKIANSIFQTIATRKEQKQSITDALTEAFSRNVISEETAASMGFDLSSKDDQINDDNGSS